jgi:hypothetical protein
VRNQRQLPLPARRRRRRYHRRRWRRRRRQQQRPQAPPSSPHSARGCDHRWSRAPGGSRPPRGAVARARAARGAGRWAGAARTGVVRGLPDWRRSYDGRSCGLGSDGRERGRVLAQTLLYVPGAVRSCTRVPSPEHAPATHAPLRPLPVHAVSCMRNADRPEQESRSACSARPDRPFGPSRN